MRAIGGKVLFAAFGDGGVGSRLFSVGMTDGEGWREGKKYFFPAP